MMSKQLSPNTQWRLRAMDEVEEPSEENDANTSFSACAQRKSSPDFLQSSSPSPRSTGGYARVGSWNNILASETASDAPSFTGAGLRNHSAWNSA